MSTAVPNWQMFAVHQRRPRSGCTPTGVEMILRSVGALNIDFKTIPDDFDLDQDRQAGGIPRNNFDSVAAEV